MGQEPVRFKYLRVIETFPGRVPETQEKWFRFEVATLRQSIKTLKGPGVNNYVRQMILKTGKARVDMDSGRFFTYEVTEKLPEEKKETKGFGFHQPFKDFWMWK